MIMRDLLIEEQSILKFIRDYTAQAGYTQVVVGVSGGLDSAVVATLAVKALGSQNVKGLILPYKTSSKENVIDAKGLSEQLGIIHKIIEISSIVDSYFDNVAPSANTMRRGNYMARIRMTVLYDHSASIPALVIGTGNKSELLTGYTTQYGDNACAFEPIGHLYKTEVRLLAHQIGVPKPIIEKKPTADLWYGQTDEGELGMSYDMLDDILRKLIDEKIECDQLIDRGYNPTSVKRVCALFRNSSFKRSLPPIIGEAIY